MGANVVVTMLRSVTFLVLVACSYSNAQVNSTNTPVVIWHGMGDTCCFPFSMGRIKKMIEEHIPGIYVHNIMIGNNILVDEERGYLGNANEEVQEVCDYIANDPELQNGFHSMGFSQGGQFLMAVAQRCPNPAMKNLITFGGQLQGVFGLPNCNGENSVICEEIRRLLNLGAYIDWIQEGLIQAQYWHDPLDLELFKEKSIFIADVINGRDIKNETTKENMQKLENLVMVRFLLDTMVIPQESEWFGFYAPGDDKTVLSLNETQLYQEDWLGLKAMDEENKLHFLSFPGEHLQFSDEWFKTEILDVFVLDSE